MDTSTYVASVASRVTDAIVAGGQTQLGISEATGIPRTTLLRRLGGSSPFTVGELKSIADTLGINVETLTAVGDDAA